MDLRLTLLFIYVCSHGVSNAEVAENGSVPLVPLIPLVPSQPVEEADNESTAQPDATAAPATAAPEETSEEEEVGGCMAIGRSPESRVSIATGVQRLGLELLQNLETTPQEPNIIISPLSISLALSQLVLGAVNETEELLMHHLHRHSLPCYHQSLRNVLVGLKNNDLQIATRIFLRQGFHPKQDFLNESRRLYDSEPSVLESLDQINHWVENATQGKMKDFLSELPPNLLILLINAVHFKGEWKSRFDPRFTSRGVFYLDDSHMVDVDVMEDAKHPLSLFIHSELEAQVARFPFMRGMSLLVVMPLSIHTKVSSLYSKLNITELYRRLPKERAVQVKVPKFKLDFAQDLQDVFTKMGMGQLFSNPNLADMTDGPLVVSSVKHKSSMEINEEGAEASAATTVVISRASNPVFHLTQPFFFALMDEATEVPVFMGVITNPSPDGPVLKKGDDGAKESVSYPFDKNSAGSFGGPPK